MITLGYNGVQRHLKYNLGRKHIFPTKTSVYQGEIWVFHFFQFFFKIRVSFLTQQKKMKHSNGEVWVKIPFILHFYHIFTYFQFLLRTFWSTHPMNLNQRALQSPDVVEAPRYFEHDFRSYRKNFRVARVDAVTLSKTSKSSSRAQKRQNPLNFHVLSFHCVLCFLSILWPWINVRCNPLML